MTRFSLTILVAACVPLPAPAIANPKAPEPPPPAGFKWLDRKGDVALAAGDTDEMSQTCEVWNVRTHRKLAVLDGDNVAAGGSEPQCVKLSPRGTLVEWANSRTHVWKNLANQTTACRGVVAPDDASCIEEDVSPFMLYGKGGERADLELVWSRPAVDGATKVVATIPRGLDRDQLAERWWTVRYCSVDKAVIDIRGGDRIVIAAATGVATVTHARAGEPPCG